MSIDDVNNEPTNQPEHHQRALAFAKDVIDHAGQYKGILEVEVLDYLQDGLNQAEQFLQDDDPAIHAVGESMKAIIEKTRSQRSIIMVNAFGDDRDLIEKFLTETINLGENRRGEIQAGAQIGDFLLTQLGIPYQGSLDKQPTLDGSVLMRFNNLSNLSN